MGFLVAEEVECGDRSLLVAQGAVQAAAQAGRRDDGEPPATLGAGLARARLFHPVPQAKDLSSSGAQYRT